MLVWRQDPKYVEWLKDKLDVKSFGGCRTLSVEKDGKITAVVLYNNYNGHNVEVSAAATDRQWHDYMPTLFQYPFYQLKVSRMTALVQADNKLANRLMKRLGFTLEGTIRQYTKGVDTHIYGMLKEECKYLG